MLAREEYRMPSRRPRIVAAVIAATTTLLPAAGRADGGAVTMRSRAAGDALAEIDAGAISVTLDFAKIVRFEQAARTVVIGNPGILDGTLSDSQTMVLTGKAAGTTNLIILGEGGQQVGNLVIHVVAGGRRLTTIHSGAAQQTFSCVGPCTPVLAVGDEPGHFSKVRGQIQQQQSSSPSSAPTQ
jgi:hypothetical protein